jgi:hypothetical protein
MLLVFNGSIGMVAKEVVRGGCEIITYFRVQIRLPGKSEKGHRDLNQACLFQLRFDLYLILHSTVHD